MVPHLRRELRSSDTKLRKKFNRLLDQQRWVDFRFRPAYNRKVDAIWACGALGPIAHELVPDLIRLSEADGMDIEAMFALARIDESAFKQALKSLRQTNPESAKYVEEHLIGEKDLTKSLETNRR